ncbi:hypothetical protein CHELA17_62805 [Chelatococcus asaccharovorans]|nr:hypothetical protein CHELA17_62805 [Chelatococcus asaccharovorans]
MVGDLWRDEGDGLGVEAVEHGDQAAEGDNTELGSAQSGDIEHLVERLRPADGRVIYSLHGLFLPSHLRQSRRALRGLIRRSPSDVLIVTESVAHRLPTRAGGASTGCPACISS